MFVSVLVLGLVVAVVQMIGMAISNLQGATTDKLLMATPSRYSNADFGFVFEYPSRWDAYDTPQGQRGDRDVIVVVVDPTQPETWVMIARHSELADGDLDGVIDWGLDRLAVHDANQIGDVTNVEIAGATAAQVDFTWIRQELFWRTVAERCRDTFLVRKTIGYALSMCTKDSRWGDVVPAFEQIARGFAVTGP